MPFFSADLCNNHPLPGIICLSLSFHIYRPPSLYQSPHPSEDRSRVLDAGCMLAAVPWPGGGSCCAAEGPGSPACYQALSEQGGHTWPQLGGQQLQAAGGPPASKECCCQEAGSRC